MKPKYVIVTDENNKLHISFKCLLVIINPSLSDLEYMIYFSTSGMDYIKFHHQTGDELYVRLDDAMWFVDDLKNNASAPKFEVLYKEILCWLVSVKAGTEKPLNAIENKSYCDALLQAYPNLLDNRDFVKYYFKGQTTPKLEDYRKKPVDGRKPQQGFVYFIEGENTGNIKIGYSVRPDKRIRELQTGAGEPLKMLCKFKGSRSKEKELHRKFKKQHLHGEWFSSSQELKFLIEAYAQQPLATERSGQSLSAVG